MVAIAGGRMGGGGGNSRGEDGRGMVAMCCDKSGITVC